MTWSISGGPSTALKKGDRAATTDGILGGVHQRPLRRGQLNSPVTVPLLQINMYMAYIYFAPPTPPSNG